MKTCSVEGCFTAAKKRGMCSKHYDQWYYQKHRERAKAYQREYQRKKYNSTRSRQGGRGTQKPHRVKFVREAVQSTFSSSDIMYAPAEKAVRILDKIIKGERLFVR